MAAQRMALMEEAELWRDTLKGGLDKSKVGGTQLTKIKGATAAVRKLKGINSRRPLVASRALYKSIRRVVVKDHGIVTEVFVGIPYSAMNARGQSIAKIMERHERGYFIIPTEKQRRFVAMALRNHPPKTTDPSLASRKVVWYVPPRPLFTLVYDELGDPEKVRARYYANFAKYAIAPRRLFG
jgi:hypothetical protein